MMSKLYYPTTQAELSLSVLCKNSAQKREFIEQKRCNRILKILKTNRALKIDTSSVFSNDVTDLVST